jgi:hypothetical protein
MLDQSFIPENFFKIFILKTKKGHSKENCFICNIILLNNWVILQSMYFIAFLPTHSYYEGGQPVKFFVSKPCINGC